MTSAKEDAAEAVKTSFCEYPNFEHIIEMIRKHGVLESVEYCKLTPGVPVKPMLATPTKGISEVRILFQDASFFFDLFFSFIHFLCLEISKSLSGLVVLLYILGDISVIINS
jgi:hypothetical protein